MPPPEAPTAFLCPSLCCSRGPTGGGEDLGTYPPCSQYEWTHSRLVLSHSLTVLSSLADTMSRPSGENLNRRGQESQHQSKDITGATHRLPVTFLELPSTGMRWGHTPCSDPE